MRAWGHRSARCARIACSWTGRSSRATTGLASPSLASPSGSARPPSARRTRDSAPGTHHIFFPPRLQLVALQASGGSFLCRPRRRCLVAPPPCASSTTDQRDRPGGGGLHASATTAASLRASNFLAAWDAGPRSALPRDPRCKIAARRRDEPRVERSPPRRPCPASLGRGMRARSWPSKASRPARPILPR